MDHKAVDGLLCPLITIDLATASGQALLFRVLEQPSVAALHLAPPCGTASAKPLAQTLFLSVDFYFISCCISSHDHMAYLFSHASVARDCAVLFI